MMPNCIKNKTHVARELVQEVKDIFHKQEDQIMIPEFI